MGGDKKKHADTGTQLGGNECREIIVLFLIVQPKSNNKETTLVAVVVGCLPHDDTTKSLGVAETSWGAEVPKVKAK